MNPNDLFMLSICLWREARSQGVDGMTFVGCVVRNRVLKHSSSYYAEVVKKLQFSSITAPGDKQLGLYPGEKDLLWMQAQNISHDVIYGNGTDITQGATLYYNPDAIDKGKTITLLDGTVVPFPSTWNPGVVKETVTIGVRPQMHVFFREI